MSATEPAKAYLIFTGSGPILLLCTYPSVTDERLIEKEVVLSLRDTHERHRLVQQVEHVVGDLLIEQLAAARTGGSQ